MPMPLPLLYLVDAPESIWRLTGGYWRAFRRCFKTYPTKARFIHGIKIATEVQDAQEEPSVVVSTGSVFVTHVYTRRPDHEEHR
jgi:hypothetical protein